MADSWAEYIQGAPDQRMQDLAAQQAEFDRIKASPRWQRARRAAYTGYDDGMVDPRAYMMEMQADQLYPTRSSDAADDMAYAANYALDFGSRPRDTMFRAMQEASKGNYEGAAGMVAQAPLSPVMPSMASGTSGSKDDWRQHTGPAQGLAIDMLTDPMNYASLGLKPLIRNAPDILQALRRAQSTARYGAGAPTFLVDDAGEVIRRLRNSPEAPQLRIEYAR